MNMVLVEEDFIKEYDELVLKLTDKFLNDKSNFYVSKYYLWITIIGELINFEKKYISRNSLYDLYPHDERIKRVQSRYHSLVPKIISNYFHHDLANLKTPTFRKNFFTHIGNNLDFDTKSEMYSFLNRFKLLDIKIINACNKILENDLLTKVDIYTLRNELLNNCIEWTNTFSIDYENNLFSIINDKIDNIIYSTLCIFEVENKNYGQLFEYIAISKNSSRNCEIQYVEKLYKEKLLPLILESKIENAILLFEKEVINQDRDSLSNEYFKKEIIEKLKQKHSKINIFPDEFDI